MELACADSFSALLQAMMQSGQKGNMNKNDKIQLADAYIEHVWLNLVLKGFHELWFLDSVAHLYLFEI